MAGGQPKMRTFRKFSFRGVDLEQLLDMGTEELVKLFHARARRRFQRGLKRKPMALIKKLRKAVDSKSRPVTGIRLFLEGKRNNCLAAHLQHLSTCPTSFQLSDDPRHAALDDNLVNQRAYFEPIKWALLSHVCTAPVQCSGASIDESASFVTKAWLEVRDIGMRKVLFLKLGFSSVVGMRIRWSEWEGPTSVTRKSGSISALISSRFSTGLIPPQKPKVEINSAVFPGGPPVPIRSPKMSRFVDTTEMTRGPDDLPGYWLVTGAKLCIEGGVISLKVKYSLLVPKPEDEL